MKAMILAAGIGTRLRPITQYKPKALVEVQGVPLLEHTIRYLKYFGVQDIIINVHHLADQIVDFLKQHDYFGLHISISDECDALMDTGGGLFKARWFFDDGKPFLLTASDVITDLNLNSIYQYHINHNPLVTLAVKKRETSREFIFDSEERLCGWHNNLTDETRWARTSAEPQKLAFSTIHVIDPRLFDLITETGAFSLTDLYLRLAAEHTILGFKHNETSWFEFGRIENLDRLNKSAEIHSMFSRFHI
jgi:NDP-sugar pyrophosphorylase family protein